MPENLPPSVRLSISSTSRPSEKTQPFPIFYLDSFTSSATFQLVNEDPKRMSGKLYPKLYGDVEAFTLEASGSDGQYIENIEPKKSVNITVTYIAVTWKGEQLREEADTQQDDGGHGPETNAAFVRLRNDVWLLLVGRSEPPSGGPTNFANLTLLPTESLSRWPECPLFLETCNSSIERIVTVGMGFHTTQHSPVLYHGPLGADVMLTAVVPRGSEPVFVAQEVLLHPVVKMDQATAIDYDGDGEEQLRFDATGSHTHEWGNSVVAYTFMLDESIYEHTECYTDESACVREFSASLKIGTHTASLTIGDRKGRLLSGENHVVHVASVDEIPGCALSLYAAQDGHDGATSDMSRWLGSDSEPIVGAPLRQGEESPLPPQWVTSSINDRPGGHEDTPQKSCLVFPDGADAFFDSRFKSNIIIRALGTIEILDGSSDWMMLEVKGGDNSAVWIQGKETQDGSRTVSLSQQGTDNRASNNRVSFEVRWLVGEAGSSRDGVWLEVKGKHHWRIVHSQRDWPPFVNKVTPDVIQPKRGQDVTIQGAGFLNPESLENATLLLNGIEVKLDDQTDSNSTEPGILEWTGTRINYRPHPTTEDTASGIQIRTAKGTSNLYPVKVSAAAQMRDVKYGQPKTLLTGLFDLLQENTTEAERLQQQERKLLSPFLRGGLGLTGDWGPDAKTFFVGTAQGKLMSVMFTSNDEIDPRSLRVYDTIRRAYPEDSLIGIAFDPLRDPLDPHLYAAHAPIYYWWRNGVQCFKGENDYAAFLGKISRLSGPNFATLETLVEGLPNGNGDHSMNGIHFDNEGNLYANAGSQTNAGWPDCGLGRRQEPSGVSEVYYYSFSCAI
mmetsp:Transcript_37048/g.92935  ORF Transcript_37048/g.92935 Transcript_37048/m.92935 type:complete len:841 (-) Transcript_37048:1057-3579(-)